ncbi:MAG TPA: carboxylesterase/lipase family protein [Bryobacteraceae bacterium]|nr:carboxylesterase/lipase family protein [Bryobacteraceae bacterium]
MSTHDGKVRGYIDQNINVFKGIPYGSDTAPRRFMKATRPQPWAGIRETVAFGPRAPQATLRQPMASSPFPTTEPISEDCLYLNIWTPSLSTQSKLPVMVYIHGGGYNAGSANSPGYDGVRLCHRGNVVVVTLNHRLNSFGFLYLSELGGPEYKDSGNVGMLDLVLALQWIRDNIAQFGGDSQRVLIFGESGGGAKNATLMGMPSAQGLFQRACSSSGETVTASRPETATGRARTVLTALGITGKNIDSIKTVPMEKLVEVTRATNYYGPVVDGGALPRHPFDPAAPNISAGIPFMVGTNHDESRLLIGRGNPAMFELTWETLPANLAKYSEKMGNLNLNDVIALYRRLHADYSASDVFFGATTDSRDWRPAVVEIERRAVLPKASAPTYSYQLDWRSPVDGGKWRACHALDLPFLFDNVAISHAMTGESQDAYWMAEQISEAYIAFARSGDPNNAKLPHWPPYGLTKRTTMSFNSESKSIDDPRGDERKLFSQVRYENPGT